MNTSPVIFCHDLCVGYGGRVILRDVSFDVARGDIFVIMGPSGCGKSTLLRAMTGLIAPMSGDIRILGGDISAARHKIGVLFQSGALFGSMTVGENVELPLRQFTNYSSCRINEIVKEKLRMVGLRDAADLYPSEISGGMKKRAGLARAMVMNPEILFLDEPSAGLDPISSRALDDLILDINQKLGTTIVMVSHELASIFAVGTDAIFLDSATKSVAARGAPNMMRRRPTNDIIKMFLTRGGEK